jgi:hypothetical protein
MGTGQAAGEYREQLAARATQVCGVDLRRVGERNSRSLGCGVRAWEEGKEIARSPASVQLGVRRGYASA